MHHDYPEYEVEPDWHELIRLEELGYYDEDLYTVDRDPRAVDEINTEAF